MRRIEIAISAEMVDNDGTVLDDREIVSFSMAPDDAQEKIVRLALGESVVAINSDELLEVLSVLMTGARRVFKEEEENGS